MKNYSIKLNKEYSELTSDEFKKLYTSFVDSYCWKYCKVSYGYKSILTIYEYFELFGIDEFILTDKTFKYTRLKEKKETY